MLIRNSVSRIQPPAMCLVMQNDGSRTASSSLREYICKGVAETRIAGPPIALPIETFRRKVTPSGFVHSELSSSSEPVEYSADPSTGSRRKRLLPTSPRVPRRILRWRARNGRPAAPAVVLGSPNWLPELRPYPCKIDHRDGSVRSDSGSNRRRNRESATADSDSVGHRRRRSLAASRSRLRPRTRRPSLRVVFSNGE